MVVHPPPLLREYVGEAARTPDDDCPPSTALYNSCIVHELSIAMSLLDVVTEMLIRENAARASRVTVEVGELSGVVPEALQTAFITATQNSDLAGCTLIIRPVPVTVWCDRCQSERPAHATNDLACTACSQLSATVIRGKELDIVEIAVE